jgi:hypothetical protein
MKRNEIVEKLINEGFSEKTLVKFTDKQLSELSERVLGEQQKGSVVMKKATTNAVDVKKMTDQGLNVELREKELVGNQKKIDANKNGKIDAEDFKLLLKKKKKEQTNEEEEMDESLHGIMIGATKEKLKKSLGRDPKDHEVEKELNKFVSAWKKDNDKKSKKTKKCEDCDKPHKDCTCNKEYMGEGKEIKNWVKNLVETEEFHSFTSKNEIMELIQTKLNESEMMVQHGPKVKKGHNGVPEFMTYDSIVAAAEPKTEPTTKPAPTKDPGTKTPPKKDPRKTPFQPGPGPNPKPKALKETK